VGLEGGPGVAHDVQHRAHRATGPPASTYQRARCHAKTVLGPQDDRRVLAQADPQAGGRRRGEHARADRASARRAAEEEPKRLLERRLSDRWSRSSRRAKSRSSSSPSATECGQSSCRWNVGASLSRRSTRTGRRHGASGKPSCAIIAAVAFPVWPALVLDPQPAWVERLLEERFAHALHVILDPHAPAPVVVGRSGSAPRTTIAFRTSRFCVLDTRLNGTALPR
jgi:hypothetical protein